MSNPTDSIGYITAKLEEIERLILSLEARHEAQGVQIANLQLQIQDYTSQWKAVQSFGRLILFFTALFAAIGMLIKTGDSGPLKALFGIQ